MDPHPPQPRETRASRLMVLAHKWATVTMNAVACIVLALAAGFLISRA